jgi:hypothetical protein
MHEDQYAAEYRQLSKVLMEYGGIVAPFMLGGEWEALKDYAQEVNRAGPRDQAGRHLVENRLNEMVEDAAFHPNHRAHLTYRSISLPHLCHFSHLIERATIHYYKRDYLSCVLLLVPAVEGTLRSYAGWKFGDPEPNWQIVREVVRTAPAETYAERRDAYADAICAFHERWFWKKTANADFSLSYLNRHYALHALGTRSYYRAIDCNRLFLYFDTFADMLMLEGHGPKHIFLPLHEPGVAKRVAYYFRIVEEPLTLPESQALEHTLLREHANFVPESNPPEYEEIAGRFAKVMGLDKMPISRTRSERVQAKSKPTGHACRTLAELKRFTVSLVTRLRG